MPVITRHLESGNGAIVELFVGTYEARRELLAQKNMPTPSPIRLLAQIDTGSALTGISLDILSRLDLTPIDEIQVFTTSPTGDCQTFKTYFVSLSLAAEDGRKFLPLVEVIGMAFAPQEGIQAMLGRDVLETCLLVYNGKSRTFSLGF